MNRDGFGLVEVMIALLIFLVGALAMAGSTTFVAAQLRAADLRTELQAARHQVVSELKGLPFDSVQTRLQGSAVTRGRYSVWWDVTSPRWSLKQVDIYTEGPGYRDSALQTVQDTLSVTFARPF